jgi:hypothetical protein
MDNVDRAAARVVEALLKSKQWKRRRAYKCGLPLAIKDPLEGLRTAAERAEAAVALIYLRR